MHANKRKIGQRGFTLVEVLAALVIVGLGMLGAIQAISQTANGTSFVRDKTVAQWVGMNQVTKMRLEPQPPKIGEEDGDVEMAGRKWKWEAKITQTDIESIRRIDVTVTLDGDTENTLASVTSFYGAAVEQPGSTSGLWPGGAGAGGGPNNPNDPNAPQDPNAPPQDPGTPGGDSPPREDDPTQVPPPEPPQNPDPGGDPGSSS